VLCSEEGIRQSSGRILWQVCMHSKVLSGSYLKWLHVRNIIPLAKDIYRHYLHPNRPISSLNIEYSISFESYIKTSTSWRLNLPHSMCLDDEAMTGLLHSLKSIQHLDISYCSNISARPFPLHHRQPTCNHSRPAVLQADRCSGISALLVLPRPARIGAISSQTQQ
jgi:hypothetical protein